MDINITLVVQMIVFAVFILFTMKFVWPPIEKALNARQDKIAEGLAAAERGQRELELAQHRVKTELGDAKAQALAIIDKAHQRASQLVDDAKNDAKVEAQKVFTQAQQQLSQEINQAKEGLRTQVADLAIAGAQKIIASELDTQKNKKLLDNLIEEI